MSRIPFDVVSRRFELVARDALHFPSGKSANILRGAFGVALARIAPRDDYARIFEPRSDTGPSGLADRPRPFVLRARHLDGETVRPGNSFHFSVNVFTRDEPASALIERAFVAVFTEGAGPGRGRADLIDVCATPVSLDLAPDPAAPSSIRVEFLSPTELKHDGEIAEQPVFPILLARARDRIAALRSLYGAGPLDIDFAAMGRRAEAVRMARFDWRAVSLERRSSRTGQTHPIGGFVGFAEYDSDLGLAEFVPLLRAAQWTGVGRQAVWGKGEIAIRS